MPAWSLGVECPYQMERGQSDRRNPHPHPTHTMVISSSLMQQNIGAEVEEYCVIGYCGARISSGEAAVRLQAVEIRVNSHRLIQLKRGDGQRRRRRHRER